MDEAVRCDAMGVVHAAVAPEQTPRIISLVPSLTELVCDLGLLEALVGRTGFCVHPREALRSIPKIGGTKDVNMETVRALRPTHLLVNIDENRREQVDALRDLVPHVIVTHPCVPEDNLALYALLGAIFNRQQAALALQEQFNQALALARAKSADWPLERVLYLIWREPWMCVAPSTYIAAMLACVGWQSLPSAATLATLEGQPRYPQLTPEAAWVGEVERVLLASEPYHFRREEEAEVAAVFARPATYIDGQMLSWYGSRAIAALRYLVALRTELAARP